MADRLRRRRNAIRNNLVNKIIPSIENTLESGTPRDEKFILGLATSEALLKDLFDEVKRFDNEIFDVIKDDEIEGETDDIIEFTTCINKTLIKIK